jgi:hypothetical protein
MSEQVDDQIFSLGITELTTVQQLCDRLPGRHRDAGIPAGSDAVPAAEQDPAISDHGSLVSGRPA